MRGNVVIIIGFVLKTVASLVVHITFSNFPTKMFVTVFPSVLGYGDACGQRTCDVYWSVKFQSKANRGNLASFPDQTNQSTNRGACQFSQYGTSRLCPIFRDECDCVCSSGLSWWISVMLSLRFQSRSSKFVRKCCCETGSHRSGTLFLHIMN